MFEQNPISKLLKYLLIGIERLLEDILAGFHRENVCICTKKGVSHTPKGQYPV